MNETKGELYKILSAEGSSQNGGALQWSLPTANPDGTYTPGEWHAVTGALRPCENGLHLVTYEHAPRWFKRGCSLWEVETRGKTLNAGDKVVAREARLLRPAALPDWWLRVEAFCVEVEAMKWLDNHGEIDPAWQVFETYGAARAAARAVAWGADWDAGWDAARDAARAAARAVQRDAAWSVTWATARDAAWDAVAWDAALYYAMTTVCTDLPITQEHRDHAATRWEVWARGYGLYGIVNGVPYVYKRVE